MAEVSTAFWTSAEKERQRIVAGGVDDRRLGPPYREDGQRAFDTSPGLDARRAGSGRGLIRTCGGIEFPALGRWEIGAGQRLTISRRRRRRRSTTASVVVRAGHLDVPEDPSATLLRLTVAPPPASGAGAGETITVTGRLQAADRLGGWWLLGEMTIDDEPPSPTEISVAYRGVFDHGARPVVLLGLTAGNASQRGGARSQLTGELNFRWTGEPPPIADRGDPSR